MTSLRHADVAAMHLKDLTDFVIEDIRMNDDDVMLEEPLQRRLRELDVDDAKNNDVIGAEAEPTGASFDEREMLEYRPQLRGHDLETTTEGQVKVTTLEDVSLDNPDYLKDMVRILHSQLEESQNTQRITR